MSDSLGDRMKGNYEKRSEHYLLRRTPVIIRVDGKAFHTFTNGLPPFDADLRASFLYAAKETAKHMQGFTLFYHQSDEVSFFLRDYQKLESAAWFDYKLQKLSSVAASLLTYYFFQSYCHHKGLPSLFDARAFNVPVEEVANYFLWRVRDWERNSVQMLCQQHFSHKQLHGKSVRDQHEMLHSIDLNWADLDGWEKNGTFGYREYGSSTILIHSPNFKQDYLSICKILESAIITEESDEE